MRIKFKAFYFIQFLSNGILGPYLALYLNCKGFTGAQIGVLLGMVPILTVLLQPVWSYVSDALNKRRILLIIACVGVSISMAGLGLTESFVATFLLSILFSIFITPIMPISTAIVLDYLDEVGKARGIWSDPGMGINGLCHFKSAAGESIPGQDAESLPMDPGCDIYFISRIKSHPAGV